MARPSKTPASLVSNHLRGGRSTTLGDRTRHRDIDDEEREDLPGGRSKTNVIKRWVVTCCQPVAASRWSLSRWEEER